MKTLSLIEIFNDCYFRIPDYQRGYAWDDKNLEDFWNDLNNIEDNQKYYMGVLTTEFVSDKEKSSGSFEYDYGAKSKESKVFYIVDGQQRLTTIIILLKAIVDRAKELGLDFLSDMEIDDIEKKFLFKKLPENVLGFIFAYTKDNPSDEFFKSRILNKESASNNFENTIYTNNLKFAKEFFYKKIKNFNENQLNSLYKKVVFDLKFMKYEVNDDFNVCIVFESMNNRGKSLSNLELLKNRFIYLSANLKATDDAKQELRKDINEVWKNIYHYLGKNPDLKLDDDDFLYNHWIMYFEDTNEVYKDSLLNKHFTIKNNKLTIQYIKDYIFDLKRSVRNWYFLHIVNDSDFKIDNTSKEYLAKLHRLEGFNHFKPLILAILNNENLTKNSLAYILKLIEKFIFLMFAITQKRTDFSKNTFFKLAHSIHTKKSNLDDMKNKILEKSKGYNINVFYQDLSDKFKWNKGYYSWRYLKYFLYEYEEYLCEKYKGQDKKLSWDEFSKYKQNFASVEHILPQEPEKYWNDIYKKYKNNIKNLTHSIGNLVALSKQRNSTFSNYDFETKKIGNKEFIGYKNGSYAEIEIALNNKWDYEEIKQRGLNMLEFMQKRWSFEDENFDFWCFNDETKMSEDEKIIHKERFLFLPPEK
ncbi:DUF262 domain-containing protein [Campylobacter sp. FMV-PI01]|uniref:DUF262 domain-containing protein n=1 Tax=Campylobacter portucalensis TaxID=2608384 RepID=A0A6L5WIQ3_9BACT|nr:DUF262 domain-containing protein [Campylobacter portucalensis]MSN95875.1 DUF262 domain-containing protein [Campylobacter portucalensis]